MNPFHFPGPVAGALHRLAGLLLLTLMAGAAHALTIDTTPTSSAGAWGGAGGNTWTPTAASSVVSASEIQSRLSGGNDVVVQTVAGDTAITVLAALNLQGRALQLESQGDVVFKAPLDAGAGSLTLLYGQGAVAAGNAARLVASAPVNLSASGQYTTRLGSDGADIHHTIITSLGSEGSNTGGDLQGMKGDLGRRYVMGMDIDATSTSGWNSGAGFEPVGSVGSPFTGSFDGLGHTIAGLAIVRVADYDVGMFGYANGAVLRNVRLVGVNVHGYMATGALAGRVENGTLSDVAVVSGSVAGLSSGGLLGSASSSVIEHSHTNIDMLSSTVTGCLVAEAYDVTIRNSYSTGNFSGTGAFAGGLVGHGSVNVLNSYSIGNFSGTVAYAGGLVGSGNPINIFNSYSTGNIIDPASMKLNQAA